MSMQPGPRTLELTQVSGPPTGTAECAIPLVREPIGEGAAAGLAQVVKAGACICGTVRPMVRGASRIHATSGATTAKASALTPRRVFEANERWYSRPR